MARAAAGGWLPAIRPAVAPLLFTVAADLLQWAMCKRGATWIRHYIDDFIMLGARDRDECEQNFRLLKQVCEEAGMPTEPEKDEGPATKLVFLGMELDSDKLEIQLPQEKLEKMRQTLQDVRGMKACQKRQLLSVVGILSHACKVVRAGKSFVHRLIDLSSSVRQLDRFVRLSREARVDLEWWCQFGQEWNGTAMMWHVDWTRPEVVLTSDASGGWGCGAWWGNRWFQLQWLGLGESASYGITAKELLPIVVAVASWGKAWQGKAVLARCDNMAVVAIVNNGSSKEAEAMHLRRCLSFLEAKWAIHLWAEHVRGVDNEVADLLSRNRLDHAFCLHPQMERRPEALDEEVLQGAAGRQKSGLDETVEELFRKGIAPTTECMYGVARRRYLRFCERYGRTPLPASERGLCQFVAFLAGEGLRHSSIKTYLAAVRQMQVEVGLGDPGMSAMAKLGQVVRGVQRLRQSRVKRKGTGSQ